MVVRNVNIQLRVTPGDPLTLLFAPFRFRLKEKNGRLDDEKQRKRF